MIYQLVIGIIAGNKEVPSLAKTLSAALLVTLIGYPAIAGEVTYRVEGEVTSIVHDYNPLLTRVHDLVFRYPSSAIVERWGLEGFERPQPLQVDENGFLVPPTTAEPSRVVPLDFEVTIDLGSPEFSSNGGGSVFYSTAPVTVGIGDQELYLEEASVRLQFDDSGEVVSVGIIPGLIEPLAPLDLSFSFPAIEPGTWDGEQLEFPEFEQSYDLTYVDSQPPIVTAAVDRVWGSGVYLNGTTVDHGVGFNIASVTVVPEPAGAFALLFGAATFLPLRRSRGS
ncbi:MAG: hypothetical protein AAF596_08900 [Planctomycetota bacterium]